MAHYRNKRVHILSHFRYEHLNLFQENLNTYIILSHKDLYLYLRRRRIYIHVRSLSLSFTFTIIKYRSTRVLQKLFLARTLDSCLESK